MVFSAATMLMRYGIFSFNDPLIWISIQFPHRMHKMLICRFLSMLIHGIFSFILVFSVSVPPSIDFYWTILSAYLFTIFSMATHEACGACNLNSICRDTYSHFVLIQGMLILDADPCPHSMTISFRRSTNRLVFRRLKHMICSNRIQSADLYICTFVVSLWVKCAAIEQPKYAKSRKKRRNSRFLKQRN